MTGSDILPWCLQVGKARGPQGPLLLRGPQHPHHHVAAPHGRVRPQLRAVAVPAQPAAGSHAAVQPKIPVPGESWGLGGSRRQRLCARGAHGWALLPTDGQSLQALWMELEGAVEVAEEGAPAEAGL